MRRQRGHLLNTSIDSLADLGVGGGGKISITIFSSLAINFKHNFNRNMAKTR